MAVRRNMALLGVLGTLLMFHSLSVHGAVERAIFTSRELHRRVRSSFYVLGYCSSPVSPECTQLMQLLESSEVLTRDSLVKTALLVYDTASWQKDLNASNPTHLWFACHNGKQIRIEPINSTAHKYSAETPDATRDTAAARAGRAAALAAECSPGVPFYACPQLTLVRIDLLMVGLAAAVQQQGAACIAAQMRNMHPAAAAISTGNLLPDAAAVAAAVAADPVTMKEAFEQGLEMHRRQQQHPQMQQRDEAPYLGWVCFYVGLASSAFALVCLFVGMYDEMKQQKGRPSAISYPPFSSSSSSSSPPSSSSAAAAAAPPPPPPAAAAPAPPAAAPAAAPAEAAAATRSPASTTFSEEVAQSTRCAAANPGQAAACGSSLTTAVAAGGLSQATTALAHAGSSTVSAGQVPSAAHPSPTAQQPAAAAQGTAGSSSSSLDAHPHALELNQSSSVAADWADWGDWPTEGDNSSTAAPATPATPDVAQLPMATSTATPPQGPAADGTGPLMSVSITVAHDPTATITVAAHPQERVESFKRRVAVILGIQVEDVREWNVTYDPVHSSSDSSSSSDDSSSSDGSSDDSSDDSSSDSSGDSSDDSSDSSSNDNNSSSSDQADAQGVDAAGGAGHECGDGGAAAAVTADSGGHVTPPPAAAAAVVSGPSSNSQSEIDRLRLDNEQLKELITHLHKESADTRNAAAAARAAAENQLTSTREALGCLQDQVDGIANTLQEVSVLARSGAAATAADASSSSSPDDRVRLSELCGLLARHGAATDSLISELASMTIGYEGPSPGPDTHPALGTLESALLLVPSQLQAARTATAAIAAMANSINTSSSAEGATNSSSSSSGGSDGMHGIISSPCCGGVNAVVSRDDRLTDLTAGPPAVTSLAQPSAKTANVEALPAATAAVDGDKAVEPGAAADTAADQMHDAASLNSSDSSDDELPGQNISHPCQLPCGEIHTSCAPPDLGALEDEYVGDPSDGSSSSSGSSSTSSDDIIPSLADSHSADSSSYSDGPPSLYDSEAEEFSSDGEVLDLKMSREKYRQWIEACSAPIAIGSAHQASADAGSETEDMANLESDDGSSSSSSSSAGHDDETPQCYQPLIDDVLAPAAATACGYTSDDPEAATASPDNSTATMATTAAAAAAADTGSLHSVPLGALSSAHDSRDTSEAAAGSNDSWDMDGGAAGTCSDDGESSSDGWQQVEMVMTDEQQE